MNQTQRFQNPARIMHLRVLAKKFPYSSIIRGCWSLWEVLQPNPSEGPEHKTLQDAHILHMKPRC